MDMSSQLIGDYFEENYTSFKGYLRYRFNTLNDYDIEDIISQTIIKLLGKGDDLVNIGNLSAYVYTSLSNGAIDYFKKYDRVELHEDHSEHFQQTVASIEEEVLLKELKQVIKKALFSLDPKSRYVFIETQLKGRPYESLVKETGEKLGSLLSRKSRAKKKLQKALENYLNETIPLGGK